MNDAAPRHPEAQTMSAFVEGKLAPPELAEVAQHLRDCGDCRTVVSETACFQREEEESKRTPITRPWLLAVAALLAAIAITIPILRWNATRNSPERNPSPIAQLIAAAPHDHRVVEARLSGFPWARMQAPSRGDATPDPADLKVAGAVGQVLEVTAAQHQPEAQHATGVAYLWIRRRNESIAALEQAARNSTDAHTWNDLAAARFAAATEDEHPSQLSEALADADHALRLDPKFPEALFNRALIIEHLGVREQAREAWKRYLDADPNSAWSIEARAHLRALEQTSRRFDPKMLETMPADALVREFPQEARTWGEGPMLASWADAEIAKDPIAESKLARVHAIATALAAFNREQLLSDAVAAIERSSSTTRAALAEGHRLYAEARLAYSKRKAEAAEAKFTHAASLFREGASPMAYMATYFAAGVDSDEHQDAKARDALTRLASSINSNRNRALAAQIQGSQAVAANISGNWGVGAREANAAASAFRSLGETKNAAYRDSVAAYSFDMIGAGNLAWLRRIRSCAALTEPRDRERLGTILRDSAATLERFDRIDGAAALIGLAINELHSDPAQLTAALTDRARLADRSNDPTAAAIALANARQAAISIADPILRATLNASIDVAYAAAQSRAQPHQAITTLTRSVAFFSQANLRNLLPDAYLQRARAFREAGDEHAAIADYDAALGEVDAQRNTIGGDDLRLRFLDTATQIIEESIEVHLSSGLVAEALDIADRTRELQEPSFVSGKHASEVRVAPRTAVLEYVVLPHAIEIFCISAGQTTVQKVAVERDRLAEDIVSFGENIRRRARPDQVRQEAAALFKLLVAPVQSQLIGIDEVVIIPDRQLYSVPFGTLYDDKTGLYFTENFPIRLVPAASMVHSTSWNGTLQPALIVADPTTPGLPRLPVSLTEGERIAASYNTSVVSGETATTKRFVALAAQSALIHYAGHADNDAGYSYGALMLAAGNGDSGLLASSDIAKLRLARHPLVVLAACGTFSSDSVHVAGMSSLARAFLLAGARAVAGTLWEVDDDVAAALFLRFHDSLRSGESPARAVRAAQIEMIHASDSRLRHPATWAPVELLSSF